MPSPPTASPTSTNPRCCDNPTRIVILSERSESKGGALQSDQHCHPDWGRCLANEGPALALLSCFCVTATLGCALHPPDSAQSRRTLVCVPCERTCHPEPISAVCGSCEGSAFAVIAAAFQAGAFFDASGETHANRFRGPLPDLRRDFRIARQGIRRRDFRFHEIFPAYVRHIGRRRKVNRHFSATL